MVLRNVPSTATFEEQRVEINELAADVEALDAAALKVESDTLQTVTGRGFTTTNPIKIENNAATAFVVEDGSSNEKFVVDSVNGKINVGSSAGGASGIYLFHNNAGATPAITLDGATGSITNKGQLVTESILSSAALNNKGSLQFGTVDAYSIGHMPLNSNLAFSQTHGGSYLFYSDASTVELEIASGGVKVDGILESSLLVNTNKTPTAGKGIEVFYDSAASGGAAGSIQSYDRDGAALTRLKIRSSNWTIENDGSAQFGVSGGNFVSVDTDGKLLARNSSSSATVVLAANFNGTDNFTVAANGTITSNSGLAASSVNLQHAGTASWFQTGTSLGGADYVWAVKNSSTNTWHGGLKTSSDLYLGGDITSAPKILLNGSNGSASFDETVTIGSGSAAPDDYGLIAYADSDTTSNKSAVYARNIGTGRLFTGDNASGATTFEVFQNGNVTIAGTLSAATGGSFDNEVYVNGSDATTQRYLNFNRPTAGEYRATLRRDAWYLGETVQNIGDVTPTGAKITLKMNGDASFAGALSFTGQTNATGTTSVATGLDHYEEGLFTPKLVGSNGGEATYTNQRGGYVRVGSLVHVYGYLSISNVNDISGTLRLSNFPFSTRNDNSYFHAPSFGWYVNLTGITAHGLGLDMAAGANSGAIVYGNGTGVTGVSVANITNAFAVEWAFTYRTD